MSVLQGVLMPFEISRKALITKMMAICETADSSMFQNCPIGMGPPPKNRVFPLHYYYIFRKNDLVFRELFWGLLM